MTIDFAYLIGLRHNRDEIEIAPCDRRAFGSPACPDSRANAGLSGISASRLRVSYR